MKQHIATAAGALAFLLIWISVESMIYDAQATANAHYCAMVADGTWNDYDADIDCGEK
jgi:hypothetical protein